MNGTQIKTLEQIRQFLEGVEAINLVIDTRQARYTRIREALIRFRCRHLGKADNGLLLDFLHKVSGYSWIQAKRWVKQSLKTGKLQRYQRTVKGFTRKYIPEDIRLLAHTSELRSTLTRPASKKLCECAWERFGQTKYQWLADISVGHLYNLRRSATYRGGSFIDEVQSKYRDHENK